MIQLNKTHPTCKQCEWGRNPLPVVRPYGTGAIPLLIIGEFPDRGDAIAGHPLSHRTQGGAMFFQVLKKSGRSLDQFYVINALNCVPPVEKPRYAPSAQPCLSQCRSHIHDYIALTKPRAILAMGDLAIYTCTGMRGKKQGEKDLNGFVLDSPFGVPVVAAINPATIITDGRSAFKESLLLALLKAINIAMAPDVVKRPTFPDAKIFCSSSELIQLTASLPDKLLFNDIETPYSTKQDENDVLAEAGDTLEADPLDTDSLESEAPTPSAPVPTTNITQIQFGSSVPGSAIVMNWTPEVAAAAKQLPPDLTWVGWNSRNFDNPILQAHGAQIDGYLDLMNAWHRFKPDLPMGLQFATSYFFPFAKPWKHLHNADPGEYGVMDIVSMQHIYHALKAQMEKVVSPDTGISVWQSFMTQDVPLMRALDRIQKRGYPVDKERIEQFRQELTALLKANYEAMLPLFPPELTGSTKEFYYTKPTSLRQGFTEDDLIEEERLVPRKFDVAVLRDNKSIRGKEPPPEVVDAIGKPWDEAAELLSPKLSSKWLKRSTITEEESTLQKVWAYRRQFNPNSRTQILDYLQYQIDKELNEFALKDPKWTKAPNTFPRGYKTNHLWEIPKDPNDPDKDWIGAKGLARLNAKLEAAGKKNPFLTLLIDNSKVGKMKTAFADSWKPTPHSLIHTTFKLSPATGQLAAVDPNILQGPKHGELAKKWRKVLRAHPGKRWVTFDFSGFHALTTGFEANDPSYIRAARIDIHGILGYTKERLPEWERLVEGLKDPSLMCDSEIAERVKKWARANAPVQMGKTFKERRDEIYKRTILGVQFGMRPRKMFNLNPDAFLSQTIAQEVWEMERSIWPKIFEYQDHQRETAAAPPHRLVTRYGYVRWFYSVFNYPIDPVTKIAKRIPGPDSEKAVAFAPANDAFGHVRDTIIWLDTQRCPKTELSWAEKFGLVNNIHDSLEFHCPDEYVEECLDLVARLMQRRNRILSGPAAPDGLWCGAEADVSEVNEGMHTSKEVKIVSGPIEFDILSDIGWVIPNLKGTTNV